MLLLLATTEQLVWVSLPAIEEFDMRLFFWALGKEDASDLKIHEMIPMIVPVFCLRTISLSESMQSMVA